MKNENHRKEHWKQSSPMLFHGHQTNEIRMKANQAHKIANKKKIIYLKN